MVRAAGQIVCSKSWAELASEYPHLPHYRSQRACFGASYLYFLLMDVYGYELDTIGEFWPLERHGTYELSWPLGVAALSFQSVTVQKYNVSQRH